MKTKFTNRILSIITAAVVLITAMPAQAVKAEDSDLPSATNISFASARDLVFDTSISEDPKAGDCLRYYKFTLSEASELVVRGNFAGECWNRYFYLYDSSMTQITAKEVAYNSFNTSFYLTGGDYYLKFDTTYDYNFVATANPLKESFVETQTTNNDVVSHASPIKLTKQYKGALTLNDDIDYYKFVAAKRGTVTLNFTNATDGGLKCAIYDKSLNSVHVNTVSKSSKIIGEKVILPKGTYYFAVTKEDNSYGVGSYKFQIDYTVKSVKK
jgi:hypothetical protein